MVKRAVAEGDVEEGDTVVQSDARPSARSLPPARRRGSSPVCCCWWRARWRRTFGTAATAASGWTW